MDLSGISALASMNVAWFSLSMTIVSVSEQLKSVISISMLSELIGLTDCNPYVQSEFIIWACVFA